jgi:tRNA modification GTPase
VSETVPQAPTYLARLTPAGAAAIATLALRGPRAWEVVRALFRPAGGRELPAEPEPGRFWVGRLGAEGEGSDEVVLTARRGGPSPWLEVHSHGGREVVRLLEEVLTGRGLEILPWEELERRTGGDELRAEALAALARAATARTASVLLDQYHGAFARAVAATRAALASGDLAEAGRLLGELASWAALGRHLTEPWRVVIAGAPNVGKSSLVNALAGYRRSVVAATPGTTRDVVTARVALDGWPVELADTAGWRADAGPLERQGIELARAAAAEADLCVWVLDAAAAPVWPEANLPRVCYVLNKVDLAPAWDLERAAGAVRVSARTGAGLAELCAALAGRLVPAAPPVGAAVPFTAALGARVGQARRLCAAGQAAAALAALSEERR